MKWIKDNQGWVCLAGENQHSPTRKEWVVQLLMQAEEFPDLDAILTVNGQEGVILESVIPEEPFLRIIAKVGEDHGMDVAHTAVLAYVWSQPGDWEYIEERDYLDTGIRALWPTPPVIPELCRLKPRNGGGAVAAMILGVNSAGLYQVFTLEALPGMQIEVEGEGNSDFEMPPFSRLLVNPKFVAKSP